MLGIGAASRTFLGFARRPTAFRCLVVLDSSHFHHIISDLGHTLVGYEDDPLARVSPSRRGLLLETLARRMLERTFPERCSQDACSSQLCLDGRRRSTYIAEWDFTLGGRRVEIKTAKLCFDLSTQSWRVTFSNVKFAGAEGHHNPFDDLYLLIYAPDAFYLIRHDLSAGVSSAGVQTQSCGHTIRFYGRHKQGSWKDALKTILDKIAVSSACEVVDIASKADALATALYAELQVSARHAHEKEYDYVPMGFLSPVARADRIQQMALEFDKMQNPNSAFKTACGLFAVNGNRRGTRNAAVDWARDDIRVELKSAKPVFDHKNGWRCTFWNIKQETADSSSKIYFDELWLAIYSPCGIHLFRHPEYNSQLTSQGVRTGALGKVFTLYARGQDHCVRSAVGHMMAELTAQGAEALLTVRWAI